MTIMQTLDKFNKAAGVDSVVTELFKVSEIGRAHVWTPVTPISRMPSSAWKKKKKKIKTKKPSQ